MSLYRIQTSISAVLTVLLLGLGSPLLHAEAVEQTVRLSVDRPADGGQCQVQAVFKGDQDNCKNDNAHGRSDCSKETGCVCTRQEKHVSWKMEGDNAFSLGFDQGSANPFVTKGDSECKLKSNKKGQLRCRVKGKDVPRGVYRYSVEVAGCKSAVTQLKIY